MAKHFKNALSLVLILSVLMGFAGCAFFDRIHVTIDPKADNVSGAEIIRLLVSAIDDDAHLSDSYAAIPENQRKGISYPDYYQYVSILRAYSNANGKIKSFRYLNEEENSKHLDSIYTKLSQNCLVDDYYTVFSNYGEVRTVVFEYEKEPEYPVYTYITLDEDGDPYLSFDLISHIISSYNYMKQYLKLITNEKVEGISALLVPEANIPDKVVKEVTLRDLLKKDSILNQKAKFLKRSFNENELIKISDNITGRTDFDKKVSFVICSLFLIGKSIQPITINIKPKYAIYEISVVLPIIIPKIAENIIGKAFFKGYTKDKSPDLYAV